MTTFSADLSAKIEGFIGRYETKRSAILPILHAIQDEHRWVSEEHVDLLEEKYGLSRVHVKEVITFYDIYHDEPVRKYMIRFCNNLTCMMLGSKDVIGKIKDRISSDEAKVGDDAPFQLEEFPCLGKCDGAPVMLVNKDRVENVTSENIDEILDRYAPRA